MTEAGPRMSISRTPSILSGRRSNLMSGRGTISRQTRGTRSPSARNSRGPRDQSANPTNRASFQYHIYHDSKNIDFFPNKRGIIGCQAWRVQVRLGPGSKASGVLIQDGCRPWCIDKSRLDWPCTYLELDTQTKDVRTLFQDRPSQTEQKKNSVSLLRWRNRNLLPSMWHVLWKYVGLPRPFTYQSHESTSCC